MRIANCSGFFGDRLTAPRELLERETPSTSSPATTSPSSPCSSCGSRASATPPSGYARTFYRQMEEVLGTCVDRGVKVVANAGGLNPAGLAQALRHLAAKLGIDVNVAHVEGDDILDRLASLQAAGDPLAAPRHGPGPRRGGQRSRERQRLPRRLRDRRGPGGRCRCGGDRPRHRRLARGRAPRRGASGGRAPTGTAWPARWWSAMSSSAAPRPRVATTPSSAKCRGSSTPASPSPRWPRTARRSSPSTPAPAAWCRWGPSPPSSSTRSAAPSTPTPTWWRTSPPSASSDVGPDRVRVSGVRGLPAPEKLKVSINLLGGYRNTMTFVLTGLDIEEKAALVRRTMDDARRRGLALRRLRRPPHPHRRRRRADQRAGQRRSCVSRSRTPIPTWWAEALRQRRHRARPGELPGLLPDVAARRGHRLRRVLADPGAARRRRRDRRPPRRPSRQSSPRARPRQPATAGVRQRRPPRPRRPAAPPARCRSGP